MSSTEDFETRHQQFQQALAQANKQNKAAVFDALSAAGITTVNVTFDGEGDSGQIQDITAYRDEHPYGLPNVSIQVQQVAWGTDKLDGSPMGMREAIDHLCYDFLGQEHDGWENNDGAFRRIHFRCRRRARFELEFNGRFTDSTPFQPHVLREASMAHPYHHSLSSVKKWGGTVDDYHPHS